MRLIQTSPHLFKSVVSNCYEGDVPSAARAIRGERLQMKSARLLVAHLMRRAGFGATPAELDRLTHEWTTFARAMEKLLAAR